MQVVDLLFCRNLGSQASATVGTASNFMAWFIIVGVGLVSSLEYYVPHSLGAKDDEKAHSYFYAGIGVAIGIGFFSMLGLFLLGHYNSVLGVNPEIQNTVAYFCSVTAPSYFAIFLVPILRVELQSRGFPRTSTYAFIFANLLNIFLNWVLVLGHLGVPALGLRGSPWASLLSRVGLLIFLWVRVAQVRSTLEVKINKWSISYRYYIRRILKMGLPTSLHLLFEMGAFILVSTLAARLSSAQNAAHSICLSIVSFSFMIPLGMSSAASLTMSKAMGEKNPAVAAHFARMTIRAGLIYACCSSLLISVFRKQILQFYTIDLETIAIGSSLLVIAAFFQFGDVLQVIFSGVLRGTGETKIQAQVNAIGHWLIGVPVGLFCGFYLHGGVRGLWVGLCAGLLSVAAGLAIRWKKKAAELLIPFAL